MADEPTERKRSWKVIFDRSAWIIPPRRDPRWIFVCFLGSYVALGHILLSFNRSPEQIVVALVSCVFLDVLYTWVSTRKLLLPLSGLISGFALCILFTAPGSTWLMLLTAWISITSKYLITWRGHHIFNPTNFGLVVMLVFSGGRVAVAPAYQFGGYGWVPILILSLGLVIMSRVNKLPAVLSFWTVFVAGAFLRSYMVHMPVEITLWAQVTGGAFMLYSFFMITDPKTSPASVGGMILYGLSIGTVDIILQLNTAVFSMFYALAIVTGCRGLYLAAKDLLLDPLRLSWKGAR